MNLESLRTQLNKLNMEIFDLYAARQGIVEQIQATKVTASLNAWSPSRELEIFSRFLEKNPSAGVTECLQYSLLVEGQALTCSQYPRWSEQQHLLQKSTEAYSMMNPVLLKIFSKEKFNQLKIKKEFATRLEDF